MPKERCFRTAVAWMFAGSWIEHACNSLIFIVLAWMLGVEAFGLVAMASAWVVFAEFLVRETFTEPLIARDALEPGHLDAAFWMLSAVSLALVLALGLSAGLVAAFYGEPIVEPLLHGLSLTILMIAAGAVPTALLRREMRFDVMFTRAVAGVVAGGIAGCAAAFAGFGVWSLVAQRLVQVGVNAVLAWCAVSWRPGLRARAQHARDILGFGSKVVWLRAAELLAVQTPFVIIGILIGAKALGAFSMAWRLTEIAVFLLVLPVRMVAQPAFAALRHAGQGASSLLSDTIELASLVGFTAFTMLALLAEHLVLTLLGPDWAAAVPLLRGLCLVGAWLAIEKFQTAFCLAAGQVGWLAVIAWFEVALGVALLIPAASFGPVAVAAMLGVRWYLTWPLRFRLVASLGGGNFKQSLGSFTSALTVAGFTAMVLAAFNAFAAPHLPSPASLALGALVGTSAAALGVALALPRKLTMLRRLASFELPARAEGKSAR